MIRRRRLSSRLVWLVLASLLALPALACGRTAEVPTPAAVVVEPPPTPVVVQPTAVSSPSSLAEVVITEEVIEEGARSTALDGVTIEDLGVQFAQDRMTLRAGQLSYGVLSLRDVLVEGTLRAEGGVPVFEATRIEPSGLAANFIPPLINQFLGMLANDWYVEDVRVEPGQLVLLVRPT